MDPALLQQLSSKTPGQRRRRTLRSIALGAVIAALYCALTLLLLPFSYGLAQVRVSEALTILPYFSAAAPQGLLVGCVLANLLGGASIFDVIFGSLATFLAAWCSRALRRYKWLVPLPPVLFNAVIVGYLLAEVYEVGAPLWTCMLYVGAGQAVSCYVLGMPLLYVLSRESIRKRLFPVEPTRTK